MSHIHEIVKCKNPNCLNIIRQCRCFGRNKIIKYETCKKCQELGRGQE